MALITATRLRDYYPALVGSADDPRLDAVIAQVDALMAAYCGYPRTDTGVHTLEDATYTLHLAHDGVSDPRILKLPVRPIASLTSVNVDSSWTYGSATAYSTTTDVTYDAQAGELLCKPLGTLGTWSTSSRANKVVVVAGYATTPAGLEVIAAAAVRDLLDRQRQGDKLSGSSAGQSWTRQQHAQHLLSDAVRASLDAGYTLWGSRAG